MDPVVTKYEGIGISTLDGITELLPDLVIGRVTTVISPSVHILCSIESPAIDAIVANPVLRNGAGRVVDGVTHSRATTSVTELGQAVDAKERGVGIRPMLKRVVAVVGA